MKGSRKTLIAIFLSVLMITTLPVGSANTDGELVKGSTHTTDSDFSDATLTNMSIVGSGEGASVTLNALGTVDNFEDGNLNEYGVEESSGDKDAFDIQSSTVYEGGNALELNSGTQAIASTSGLGSYPQAGDHITYYVHTEFEARAGFTFGFQNFDNRYMSEIRNRDGEIRMAKRSGGNTETLAGESVTVPDDTWLEVKIDWGDDGNIVQTVTNTANGNEVSSITATDSEFTDGGIGFESSSGTGRESRAVWDYAHGEGGGSGEYISPTHEVSEAQEAEMTVSEVTNVNADFSAEYHDGNSWVEASSETVTSTGSHTLTLPDVASSTWRIRVNADVTGNPRAFTFDEDSILFTNQAPTIDNASATPSGGETITDTTIDMSIDVTDEDFGSAQGDEIDVTFYNASNDSSVGTDTVTNNGTASVEWDNVSGGADWYAIAEDRYGGVTQSQTFSFSAPESLSVYNESAPNELIDNVDVEIQFYFEGDSGQIVTRTTTNGSIDMRGLPADQPFIAVAEAEGYHPRRIYIDSLLEEQQIYLLPEDEDYVDLTFDMEDFTGRFPQDTTVMKIERELNGNWSTVQGDFFGGTGQFTAQLEHNTRHRLTLINTETGERRQLGTLTPTASGVQPIEVTSGGDIELVGMNPTISVSPSTRSLAAVSGSSVGIGVSSGNKQISEWTATVTYNSDSETVVLHNETVTGGPGSITPTFNLSERDGGSVSVDVEVVLENGSVITDTVKYGVREHFDHEYSLLSTLSNFETLLPGDGATTFLASVCTVLITGAIAGYAQVSSEVLGGVAVGSIAFFSIIGWVGIDLLFAGAVTWVAVFGLRRGI